MIRYRTNEYMSALIDEERGLIVTVNKVTNKMYLDTLDTTTVDKIREYTSAVDKEHVLDDVSFCEDSAYKRAVLLIYK